MVAVGAARACYVHSIRAPDPSSIAIEYRIATPAPTFVIGAYSLALPGVSSSPMPTPTPTPTPTPVPVAPPPTEVVVAQDIAQPSSSIDSILAAAGWPASLIPEASRVAWCESRYQAWEGNGFVFGLFQEVESWYEYFSIPFSEWQDPVVNAHVALLIYQYDVDRGYDGWAQWQCKP